MTPCLKRIDAECFRAHPAWAKRAIAYRLVHLLTPKPLTKRLPKGLRLALVAPGVEIPPGVELPPGVVVSPGAQIPPGWTPGDPLPSGAIPPATYPPDVDPSETGPTPPLYVEPWSPGPVTTAKAGALAGVYFYDPFTNLDLTVWTKTVTGTAAITPIAGYMEFLIISAGDVARLRHTHADPVPDNCDISFILYNGLNTDYIYLAFDTATRSIGIKFETTGQIEIWDSVQWVTHTGISWEGSIIEWTLKERSGVLNVFRSIHNVVLDQAHGTESTNPGRLTIYAKGQSVNMFDYLRIAEV